MLSWRSRLTPSISGPRACPKLENDKLYRVVSGMYSAQMAGHRSKDKSFGILSIVPKDENGQPITDFSTRILRDKNGNEIKEWYALAAYLHELWHRRGPLPL